MRSTLQPCTQEDEESMDLGATGNIFFAIKLILLQSLNQTTGLAAQQIRAFPQRSITESLAL